MMTAEDKSIYGQIKTKGEQLAELVKMAENIQNNNDKNAAEAYHRGLDDAWKAARNISMLESDGGYSWKEMKSIFGTDSASEIYVRHTAAEAINKIKAYEEKQNDKIVVGDEVLWFMKGDDEGCDDIMDVCAPSVVTMVPNKECDDYTIIESSGAMTVISKEQIYKKTGRHFNIASILEDMRND